MERQYICFRTGRAFFGLGLGFVVTTVAVFLTAVEWPDQRLVHWSIIVLGSAGSVWLGVRLDRSLSKRWRRRHPRKRQTVGRSSNDG